MKAFKDVSYAAQSSWARSRYLVKLATPIGSLTETRTIHLENLFYNSRRFLNRYGTQAGCGQTWVTMGALTRA